MKNVELLHNWWGLLEDIDELIDERSDEILTNLRFFIAKVEVIVENGSSKASSKMVNDRGAAWRALFLIQMAWKATVTI